MIESLFDETVSVQRLQEGTGNQMEYATNIVALRCAIQQADSEISTDLVGSYGKDWLMFCPIVDILEGDRVIWNGKTYRVTAVDRLNFHGEKHMEIGLRIFES